MAFIFHGSLGTGRELHDLPNKIFFSKCLSHRTLDAEFDAESKYQVKICRQSNFNREKLILLLIPSHIRNSGGFYLVLQTLVGRC
jgi:hypothetical protein